MMGEGTKSPVDIVDCAEEDLEAWLKNKVLTPRTQSGDTCQGTDDVGSNHRGTIPMSSNGIVHQVPEASGGDTGLFSHSEELNGPVIETGEVPVVESELVVEARDVEARDSAVEAENIRMSDPVIEAGNDSVLADEAVLPDQSPATSSQAIEAVASADRVGHVVCF
ncbi:hypothetical protein V6N13_137907 [Hibiscus sabdariffa]